MVSRKVKFSISVEKIEVNFEGSQELGRQIQQGFQQALGGLMNTQGRLLSMSEEPGQVIDGKLADTPDNGQSHQSATDTTGDKSKQPRQRRTKGGPTVGDLLTSLKEEAFFSQPRTGGEVLARLKDKGHNSRQSSVLTALQRMVQKYELYRELNDENVYVYKDSPFHAAPGNSSSADQPPQ